MAHLILTILALICFLVGVVELPRFSAARCIAMGLFLLTLAELIGAK
jgi:hypothetical protein